MQTIYSVCLHIHLTLIKLLVGKTQMWKVFNIFHINIEIVAYYNDESEECDYYYGEVSDCNSDYNIVLCLMDINCTYVNKRC